MGETLAKLRERQLKAADRVAQETARQRQLDARIKREEKAISDAKAFTIGRAVLAEMENDKSLAKTIGAVLEKSLKTPRERQLFGLKTLGGTVEAEFEVSSPTPPRQRTRKISEGEPVNEPQTAA